MWRRRATDGVVEDPIDCCCAVKEEETRPAPRSLPYCAALVVPVVIFWGGCCAGRRWRAAAGC